MDKSIIQGLFQNIAILLAFSLIYDYIWSRYDSSKSLLFKILAGFIIGVFGIILMLSPWKMMPGIVFDVRSVLLSISGLFFGPVPTLLAMLITGAYRFSLGGSGMWMGMAVILSSGTIGILWNSFRTKWGIKHTTLELLFMGFAVHLAMLACALLLPSAAGDATFKAILFPVLTVYPIATMLFGLLLIRSNVNAQNQKKLQVSEKRFRTILNNATDALYLTDNEGKIVDTNDQACKELGYSYEELLARNLIDIDTLNTDKEKIKAIFNAFIPGEPLIFETVHRRKDGSTFPVEISSNSIDLNGELFIIGSARNLTDRRLAEVNIRESEEKFRSIFNNHSAAKLLIDSETGNITDANEAATKFYGWSLAELRQMKIQQINTLSSEEVENVIGMTQVEKPSRFEFGHRLKDGSVRNVEVFSSKIEIAGKVYLHSIIHDISERKLAEESLQKLNLAIRQTREVIFITDKEGIITFINPEFTNIYGYDAAEVIGIKTPRILKSGIISAAEDQRFWKALVNKKSLKAEYRNKCKDGSLIDIEGTADPILGDNDEIIGYLGIHRNITERKQAEEVLRTSEQMLQTVLENFPGVVFWKDKQSNYLGCNQSFAHAAGLNNPAEVAGKTDFQLAWGATDGEQYQSDDFKVMESGKAKLHIIETQHQANGQLVWHDTGKIPLRDSKGDIVGLIGVSNDITERKRAEDEAKESFSLLTATLESTADGILVVDKNGMITNFNKKFVELWQIPESIIASMNDEQTLSFILDQLKDPFNFLEKIEELHVNDALTSFDILDFKNGRTFERYSQSQIIEGKAVGRVWSFRDVTEKKEMVDDLMEAKERAEESDRLKTAFLHNISHEVRTPMNAIVGFAEFLNDPDLFPEERKQYTEIIVQSSKQLLSIISDIINIATIEAGQVKVTEKEMNLNATIRLLKEQFVSKARENDISLSLTTALSDREAIIQTDETKLTEILTNLLENAIKFTRQGTVSIGYALKEDLLEFYVEDTGMGIPPDMHDEIFNRFSQVGITALSQFGGSGLGLSISKAYVEMLGGRIWLTSEPGKGSVFYFTIPYKNIERYSLSEIQPGDASKFKFPGGKTILIAEDDNSNFILLEALLSGLELTFLWAKNGIEAIELCETNPQIDLVLMDMSMPGLDGFEATKRIREFRPYLPVIAQTAYSTPYDKGKAIACGCIDFITKPYKKELLIAKIKAHME